MQSIAWQGDWPVTQPFIPGAHCGIDIGCPTGTIIHALRAGVVERVQQGMTSVRVGKQRDFYLHGTTLVPVGRVVAQGQDVICSGAVPVDPRYPPTGPHLHFEVQDGFTLPGAPPWMPGAPLDPVPFLQPGLYGADGNLITGGLHMDDDVHAAFVALQNELTDPTKSPILQAQKANTAAIVAAIKAIPPPLAPVIDTGALAAAIVALLPAPSKAPAPPQAVWDWLGALRKWLGW